MVPKESGFNLSETACGLWVILKLRVWIHLNKYKIKMFGDLYYSILFHTIVRLFQ